MSVSLIRSEQSREHYLTYIYSFYDQCINNQFKKQYSSSIDTMDKQYESIKRFSSKSIKINFEDYVSRVVIYSESSSECLIYSLLLIKRLESKIGYFLNRENMFLFFFICYYISIRLLDDDIFSIDVYSKISGVKKSKIVELENTILEMIDYKIYFSFEEFSSFKRILLTI